MKWSGTAPRVRNSRSLKGSLPRGVAPPLTGSVCPDGCGAVASLRRWLETWKHLSSKALGETVLGNPAKKRRVAHGKEAEELPDSLEDFVVGLDPMRREHAAGAE